MEWGWGRRCTLTQPLEAPVSKYSPEELEEEKPHIECHRYTLCSLDMVALT